MANHHRKREKKEFIHRIFQVLQTERFDSMSWTDDGDAFVVDRDKFMRHDSPHFFQGIRFHSFTRRLRRYGFCRVHRTNSADAQVFRLDGFQKGGLRCISPMEEENQYPPSPSVPSVGMQELQAVVSGTRRTGRAAGSLIQSRRNLTVGAQVQEEETKTNTSDLDARVNLLGSSPLGSRLQRSSNLPLWQMLISQVSYSPAAHLNQLQHLQTTTPGGEIDSLSSATPTSRTIQQQQNQAVSAESLPYGNDSVNTLRLILAQQQQQRQQESIQLLQRSMLDNTIRRTQHELQQALLQEERRRTQALQGPANALVHGLLDSCHSSEVARGSSMQSRQPSRANSISLQGGRLTGMPAQQNLDPCIFHHQQVVESHQRALIQRNRSAMVNAALRSQMRTYNATSPTSTTVPVLPQPLLTSIQQSQQQQQETAVLLQRRLETRLNNFQGPH